MENVYVSRRDGIVERPATLVIGDFAAVPEDARPEKYADVVWLPSGLAVKSLLRRGQAKDAVKFLATTKRGRKMFDMALPVSGHGETTELMIELRTPHPSGTEQPYKPPVPDETIYEVEGWLAWESLAQNSRHIAHVQDLETAMALAIGYEMQNSPGEQGYFVRVVKMDTSGNRTLLWWAMWDQDGWRTMHKDPSLPFDPDKI